MTASHPSQKHIVEKTSGTAQPLPNRHWPQQVITTLGGREEIVHVAMPEEDKRDATLPRSQLAACSFGINSMFYKKVSWGKKDSFPLCKHKLFPL